jgi:RNA polymerase sigma factor (sigma-70 family)
MHDQPLKQLLIACKRGNSQAQRQLFEQHQSRLFSVCLRYSRDRHEANDILQEAFLAIFRDLGQFNGKGVFEGWLHRVTVRSALQYLRRKNPLRFADDYDDLPSDTWQINPDMELNSAAILQMVQKLPDGYRTVFNLHCMEGYSYTEIAVELGIAESTARSQYTRACQQLRGLVEKFLTISA